MRDPQNIAEVKTLGIDIMGLIFYPKSPRYVDGIHVPAGTVPDMPAEIDSDKLSAGNGAKHVKMAGVFVNEMPQTIITHAYNYSLDYLQLHGDESATYIRNLRASLVPDICPHIKIIKVISVREADDVKRWREYDGVADLLFFDTKCKEHGGSGEKFDWSVINAYDGTLPFILSGGIGPDDVERVREIKHPMCIGIDLNSRFETAPAMKDVECLRTFISKIRRVL